MFVNPEPKFGWYVSKNKRPSTDLDMGVACQHKRNSDTSGHRLTVLGVSNCGSRLGVSASTFGGIATGETLARYQRERREAEKSTGTKYSVLWSCCEEFSPKKQYRDLHNRLPVFARRNSQSTAVLAYLGIDFT